MRENRAGLLRKCVASSNPRQALQMLVDCGMKVRSELFGYSGFLQMCTAKELCNIWLGLWMTLQPKDSEEWNEP